MPLEIDPVSASVSALNLLVGGAQALIGGGQVKRANEEMGRLFKQRKAYQTPEEIMQIVQMQQNNAQTGFGAETTEYLTTGANRGLAAGLGTAKMLGADPNALGGILDGYFQDIFKIGGENELLKMKKFDGLIDATKLLAQHKDAEWQSEENLIKDQLQAASAKAGAGQLNLQSGINLGLNALSSFATNNLYNNTPASSGQDMEVTETIGAPPATVNIPSINTRQLGQQAGNTVDEVIIPKSLADEFYKWRNRGR